MKKWLFWLGLLLGCPSVNALSSNNHFRDLITQRLHIDDVAIASDCNNDEQELFIILEIKRRVMDAITEHSSYTLNNGKDSITTHAFATLIINADNEQEAIDAWRASGDNFTPDDHIAQIHQRYFDILHNEYDDIKKASIQNIYFNNYAHDAYQQQQWEHPLRSFNAIMAQGIRIVLPRAIQKKMRDVVDAECSCSLIEQFKMQHWASINGFPQSKLALAVHDCFDHMWTYYLLEKEGVLKRHAHFLQKIGNPHLTDMYNRESEIAASVGFEFRFSHLRGTFEPILSWQEIAEIIDDSQERSEEFKRYCPCVVTNVLIELFEQRRKFGFIRILDHSYAIKDTLDVLDKEHISFIVDCYTVLYAYKEESFKALETIVFTIEEYLQACMQKTQTKPLVITIDTIQNFKSTNSTLSEKQKEQLKRDFVYLTDRRSLC